MSFFASPPLLETARLTLRGHVASDFAELLAMWSDPPVTRFIGGRPSTEEEAWARLLRYVGHWPVVGYGYWVIREKASRAWVGEAGFANFHREVTPPFGDSPEAGWVVSPQLQGKGYATEAVSAVVAWGDQHLPSRRTVCMIDPDNLPSLKVAERCGFREFGRTVYKGSRSILFERVRP